MHDKKEMPHTNGLNGTNGPGTTTKSKQHAVAFLSDLASSLNVYNTPGHVRRQALLCILDTLGCSIAGVLAPETAMMLQAEAAGHPSTREGCIVYGTKQRLPVAAAARVNAYAGDLFELNDLLGGHASIGNVSAALALAEQLGSSGADLVSATVGGLEVTTRVFNAIYTNMKPYTQSLLVPVGLPSSVGAATICAKLLGLDQQQMREALAIGAATAEVCPAEVIFYNGGTMKPLLFGALPAATGVQAAYLARSGVTGPPLIIDGDFGFFSTMTAKPDLGKLTDPSWGLERVTRKLHACCGHVHSALDGVAALRKKAPTWPPKEIILGLPDVVISTVGNKSLPPTSSNEARFHIQYLIAVAAVAEADFIRPAHSLDFKRYLADSRVTDLLANVKLVEAFNDEDLKGKSSIKYHYATVKAVFADGTTAEQLIEAPRGSPGDPLDEAGVIDKFLRLATDVAGAQRARAICDAVLDLENAPSVAPLFKLLAGPW